MRGYINGIWLTQPGGKLHPAIVPNLELWVADAASSDFGVVLWTNLAEIAPKEVESLKSRNVIVKDHSLCESSNLYKYFLFFLNRGINGDKAAFALASDVLRMAILELADDDEYFIYADPNDVMFVKLKNSLAQLPKYIANIPFGFSFYVEPINEKLYLIRNDVLIAHKVANPSFFKDYLAAYLKHITINHVRYVKPTTDAQAQELARTISNQTEATFFRMLLSRPFATVMATFGNYRELSPLVHCLAFLPHKRSAEYSNTWAPEGEFKEEGEQLRLLGLQPVAKKLPVTAKPMILSDGIISKPLVSTSDEYNGAGLGVKVVESIRAEIIKQSAAAQDNGFGSLLGMISREAMKQKDEDTSATAETSARNRSTNKNSMQ